MTRRVVSLANYHAHGNMENEFRSDEEKSNKPTALSKSREGAATRKIKPKALPPAFPEGRT
jgi:hypothetical protein